MLKIGLTGGIGSGKTTVANLFGDKGVPLIDADVIAHSLVEPTEPAFAEIVNYFGQGITDKRGYVDRTKLRHIVFDSPKHKKALEAILHPLVFEKMTAQVKKLSAPYCLLSIPLIIESGRQDFIDRILVVDCPMKLQMVRVTQRDNLNKKQLRRIIDTQSSRWQKLQTADDVIVNDGALAKLEQQVNRMHQLYLSISEEKQ